MSDASFTAEQEHQVYGNVVGYNVTVPIKVIVNFGETGLDFEDALREAVRKKLIILSVSDDEDLVFEYEEL